MPSPFYINYEECKYLSKSFFIFYTSSFILTMRNVNNIKLEETDLETLVLY